MNNFGKTPSVKEGDVINVTIESVGTKGDGVAKVDGYVIIVPGAEKDAAVEVRITRVLPSYAFAERV